MLFNTCTKRSTIRLILYEWFGNDIRGTLGSDHHVAILKTILILYIYPY